MLKLFEKSTVLQVVFILAATALLWIKAFGNPQPMAAAGDFAPLYTLLEGLSLSPLLSVAIAMILVLLGGFLFNLMLTNAGIASQNSLLPTMMFVAVMSASSPSLSPQLLAALITIAVVNMLMLHSTLLTVASDKIFGAAALIGIASLFYLPALTLVVAYLLIAINYRLYGWRDWMVFLLGLAAPYLLLWTVQYLQGNLAESFAAMGNDFSSISLSVGTPTALQAVANAFLLGAFAISLFVVWRRLGEKTVVWQKNATTVMVITLAALAILPFAQIFPADLHFFAIPFAFCAAQRLDLHPRRNYASRRPSWRQYLYDLLFVLIIVAAILC